MLQYVWALSLQGQFETVLSERIDRFLSWFVQTVLCFFLFHRNQLNVCHMWPISGLVWKKVLNRDCLKKKKNMSAGSVGKKRNCWVEIEILKVCASTNTLKLPTTAAHAWNGISPRLIIDIDENMDKSSNLCNILSLKRIKGQCKIDWNKTRILSQIYPQSCTDELISWSSWLRQMSTVKKSAKYLKSAQDFIT